jgi:hypothetical protein
MNQTCTLAAPWRLDLTIPATIPTLWQSDLSWSLGILFVPVCSINKIDLVAGFW